MIGLILMHDTSFLNFDLNLSLHSSLVFINCTRIEEFAAEEPDLTLSTHLEFNTPLADLSDVKTMMDSINVVPGLIYKQMKVHFLPLCLTVITS